MIELKYMVSDAFCNKTKIFAAQVSKKWQQEKKKVKLDPFTLRKSQVPAASQAFVTTGRTGGPGELFAFSFH